MVFLVFLKAAVKSKNDSYNHILILTYEYILPEALRHYQKLPEEVFITCTCK